MKMIDRLLTKNPCYTKNVRKANNSYITFQKRGPLGLMLHSVGVAQPSAEAFIRTWDSPTYSRACVHGFIDANTGTVYHTLPWNFRGWHCAGSGNNTHIGVEMCEPAGIKYVGGATIQVMDKAAVLAGVKRTYQAAVELFAMLCKQYNLDPLKDGVIVSHREGHSRGIASNHADPEHLWTQLGTGYTMSTFRKAVYEVLRGGGVTTPETLQTGAQGNQTGHSVPYRVRVTVKDLNIRGGAGTNYASKGKIAPGVYTISEESTGKGASLWGKLKSGAGWISLDFVTRI